MTERPNQPRYRRSALPTGPALPRERRERYDADLADSADDHVAIDELHAIAERSASLIDDAVNAVEAAEDRNAAHAAQAMR